MQFSDVRLESIHCEIPPLRVTSEHIEEKLSALYKRLKLPIGRLFHMTGIAERRFWPKPFLPSKIATNIIECLLQKSRIAVQDIDLLIYAGVCRDHIEPATAAYIHQNLKLSPKTQFFDLSNACLGFLNGITMAAGLIQAGQIRTALIVSAENGQTLLENTITKLLNSPLSRKTIKPYFANLTIGGGGVAAMISHQHFAPENTPKIIGAAFQSDTASNHLCEGGGDDAELSMQTDSERLLEAGITLAQSTWNRFRSITGWVPQSIDKIICHQVGKRHQQALYEALGLDPQKDFSTYAYLGNTGSAALPLTLAQAMNEGAIAPKDSVALLGIGSGLSSIMMGLEF